MLEFNKNANWRYATKKYDATKKISAEDLEKLKSAIQLSASSFGLQPYKVLIVENPEIRKELVAAAWGQAQVAEASHLFVFANVVNIDDTHVSAYFEDLTSQRNIPMEAVSGYSDFVKSKLAQMPNDVKNVWTSKQTYLALGNLLNAAAELKIDTTPMEGFEPEKFNEILGLTKLGLNASVIATVGYRHDEDATQHYKKVRKSQENLFITL